MEKMPEITRNELGAFWKNTFNSFDATVYVPYSHLQGDILNYGFIAPYILVFAENHFSYEEAADFAEKNGLKKLASDFDSSVVFIYPVTGSWESASPDILSEIISNSRIHQLYKDGFVTAFNFFKQCIEGYFIRGAIFRTLLCGYGAGADYIAKNCMRHFECDGLWGRSDLAPASCVLNKLSLSADLLESSIQSDDIPVISYGNSTEINAILKKNCKYFISREAADIFSDYYGFAKQFRRMTGPLQIDEDLEKDGLVIEPGIAEVRTSLDNCGQDRNTDFHKIGYFAFYNKNLFDSPDSSSQPLPLVLGFHGGGDSCFFLSTMAGWAKITHRHNFLFVAIENHLNSTATEMVEFVEILKKKYNIDSTRIYATGFSMGGCKTWDLIQEYPELLAAAAPMDATFDVGRNIYDRLVETGFNTEVPVPVFYAGGEVSPLPELPYQAQKCLDRMAYVLKLNNATAADRYCKSVNFENKDKWENKLWGINGDIINTDYDASRNATLTMQLFKSIESPAAKLDSVDHVMTVFASISEQGHDCREHTCEHAWNFMSHFRRVDGKTISR